MAALLYATCNFIENSIVDNWCRRIRPQCLKIMYLGLDLIVILAVFIWQGFELFSTVNISMVSLLVIGGAVNALGDIPYYLALKKDDTTGITLLGQMSPILTLVMGVMFLSQVPTLQQGTAFVMVMAAIALLVFGVSRKEMKVELAAGALMFMACLFWASSDILFVSQAGELDFIMGFFWLMLGSFVANTLMVIVMKKWRQDAAKFWRKNKGRKTIALIGAEITFWGGEMIWRLGMLTVPVAIMSVTGNIMQLILTFMLGIILTAAWPKFGREKMNKKMIINHALATVMMVVAILILG
jgi:Predicted membrane protein